MSVIVENLSDIVPDQEKLNPIFNHFRGGMVVWDANLSCHFVSTSLDYIVRFNGNGALAASPALFLGLDSPRKGRYQRHFHTPQGTRHIDATLQLVMDKTQRLVGYVAICQDVTELQEPIQFQSQFIELLKTVAMGENTTKTVPVIYKCFNQLGFQDMKIILYKNNSLEIFSQIVGGRNEALSQSADLAIKNDGHPLAFLTREFNAGGILQIRVATWERNELVILPITDQAELLGYVVLSGHQTSPIPSELLDAHGKLSFFHKELNAVFRRIFFHNPNGQLDPSLLLRSRLETFNLNQKQIRILEMVLKGESNKGIADVVHLSEQGVKYHVGNLLERFQCKNRVELRSKLHQLLNAS